MYFTCVIMIILMVIIMSLQVTSGLECGLSLGSFKGWAVGDVVECVKVEYKTRDLRTTDNSHGSSQSHHHGRGT